MKCIINILKNVGNLLKYDILFYAQQIQFIQI